MDEQWVYFDPVPVKIRPTYTKLIKPSIKKTPKEYTIFISTEEAENEWKDRVLSGIVF